MIDHVTVRVQDFPRLLEFYKAALAPLRYEVVMQFEGVAGLGADGKPDLWLMQTDQPLNPTHLALAGERDAIDAFHTAALEAGASDNGPPGLRPDYHPHYYAGFVRDPEGNNIEVVCHADPEAKPTPPEAAPRKSAARASAAKPRTAAKRVAKPATKGAAKRPAKPAAKKSTTKSTKKSTKKSARRPAKKTARR
ncbi:MAG TPA: VOC family protein [Polyangia bacterium]|nr:VOC family protein [Polyangia bacterium]